MSESHDFQEIKADLNADRLREDISLSFVSLLSSATTLQCS